MQSCYITKSLKRLFSQFWKKIEVGSYKMPGPIMLHFKTQAARQYLQFFHFYLFFPIQLSEFVKAPQTYIFLKPKDGKKKKKWPQVTLSL